jgi:hypothetical protein
LNKIDALAVMHEILEACNESLTINSVSLDPLYSLNCMFFDGFKITMKCDLDERSRRYIQPILDKRNLKMDTTKGNLMIYQP